MSNKKSIRSIVVSLIIVGLITGCVKNKERARSDINNPVDENSVIATHAGEAEITENIEDVEVPVFDFLEGGVYFEVDNSTVVELLVDANATEEQRLTLYTTDSLTWTLTIPPNAVDADVPIKMSELAKIESGALGSLRTGVLLEPDGLEFIKPVTLQIEGEGLGTHPLIFSGSHDGTEFDFANITPIEGGISASITHFSAAYADPLANDPQYKKAQQAASDGYKRIREFALSFLKEKVYAPKPPAIPLRCPPNKAIKEQRDHLLNVFLEEFSMPELALINMVETAGSNDEFLNLRQNDSIEISRLLYERLLKKADMLYETYYPKEEYSRAIIVAGLSAERAFQRRGGSPDDEGFIAKAGRWARQIADAQLKALREQHDYQLITTMIQMDREATGLGSGKENSLGEIEKAVQFKLQYDVQVKFDLDVGDETISTHGAATFNGMDFGKKSYYESGKGQYVGFEASLPEPLTATLNMPAAYTFDTRIENFDACEEFSFDLILNKFSDDTETYTYSDGEFETTQMEGIVAAILYSALESEVVETLPGREGETFYKFTIPLQNLNPTTGEIEVTREIPNCTVTVRLKLVHTPK